MQFSFCTIHCFVSSEMSKWHWRSMAICCKHNMPQRIHWLSNGYFVIFHQTSKMIFMIFLCSQKFIYSHHRHRYHCNIELSVIFFNCYFSVSISVQHRSNIHFLVTKQWHWKLVLIMWNKCFLTKKKSVPILHFLFFLICSCGAALTENYLKHSS